MDILVKDDGVVTLVSYKLGEGQDEIDLRDSSITEIGEDCFRDCEQIKNVKLPYSLKTIRARAFMKCVNMEEINFPETIEEIGNQCFLGCRKMKITFRLWKNLHTIGDLCFYDCRKMEVGDLIFRDDFRKIGSQAFTLYVSSIEEEEEIENENEVYVYFNSKSTIKELPSPFKGLNIVRLKRENDYSHEEEMGIILKKFVQLIK